MSRVVNKLFGRVEWQHRGGNGAIVRTGGQRVKDEGGASRTVLYRLSDRTVDRAGDVLDPLGCDLAAFKSNPVALAFHDSTSLPIGRWKAWIDPSQPAVMGELTFAPADVSPFAETLFRLVTGGFMPGVSVGFIPVSYELSKDPLRRGGVDFTKWTLLEASVVPVPCNPAALAQLVGTKSATIYGVKLNKALASSRLAAGAVDALKPLPNSDAEKYQRILRARERRRQLERSGLGAPPNPIAEKHERILARRSAHELGLSRSEAERVGRMREQQALERQRAAKADRRRAAEQMRRF